LTVAETLAVAHERHLDNRSMFADALRQPRSWESERDIDADVEQLIADCGLEPYRDTLTSVLSTGTRRVVELACQLAAEPSVLLLDEPSAGVAQREAEALAGRLLEVRDRTGAAMVIVEHDMGLLRSVCDRLIALELGAVIAEGRPEDVIADPKVIASYLGTDERAIARSDHQPQGGVLASRQ
jgi:branched-chain amino acid transport system ATP-binding protein